MTTAGAWTFGSDDGTPTWFTADGARLVYRKGKGLACAACAASGRPTTTLELLALLARHEHCRPAWARKENTP